MLSSQHFDCLRAYKVRLQINIIQLSVSSDVSPMDKEILMDQIMGLLNSTTGSEHGNEHDSLRFSTDYDPTYYRYTKDDQIEDIKFQFHDEDEGTEKRHIQQSKKTEAVPPKKFEISFQTKDNFPAAKAQAKNNELSKSRVRQKNSLKLGEIIKKKIELKDDSDEFTKKYDNLFDQVFNQSKIKQTKQTFKENANAKKSQLEPSPSRPVSQRKPEKVIINSKPIVHEPTYQDQRSFDKRIEAMQHKQGEISKSQQDVIQQLNANSLKNIQARQAQEQSKINIKISESLAQKLGSGGLMSSIVMGKTKQEKGRKLSDSYNQKPNIQMSRHKTLSDSVASNDSFNSLKRSESSIPQLITRENYQMLANHFAHKPQLVQSLKPPIKVTYQDKKQPVHFVHSNQLVPPQTNFMSQGQKPAVKFSFGKTGSSHPIPVSQGNPVYQTNPGSKPPTYINTIIKQEVRLPPFLRKFRQLTNSYPNFYSKKTFEPQNIRMLNEYLYQAFQEAKKAIKTLKLVHLRYHEMVKQIKELYNRISRNVDERGGAEDSKLLQFFTNNDWTHLFNNKDLQSIKPCDLFEKRVLNELQFMTLLNSYEELIYNIQEEEVLKPTDPQTVKKYMELRDKLWAIEKNLRIMSQDFYLKAIIRVHLPQHIADAARIIKDGGWVSSQDEKNYQLDRLLFLQEKRDMFASSCLGKYIIKLLLEKQ